MLRLSGANGPECYHWKTLLDFSTITRFLSNHGHTQVSKMCFRVVIVLINKLEYIAMNIVPKLIFEIFYEAC